MIKETPKIYVADLAAYNAGKLHGVWIDATQDLDDLWDEINSLLKASPEPDAEEYAIHDYEYFEGYSLHEYEGIEKTNQIALLIAKHGKVASEILTHCCGEIEQSEKMLEEAYLGVYESVADYAEERTTESTKIPENLQYYIDYEKMANDMILNGEILAFEISHDEVHIFTNS